MNPKDEKKQYGVEDVTGVPASEEAYSLEEILAEFGGSLEQTLLKEAEPPSAKSTPGEDCPPAPETGAPTAEASPRPAGEKASAPPPANPPPEEDRQDIPSVELDILDMALPKAPRPVTLEDMVGSTVDAVMEEASEPLLPPRRRGLFSRRPLEETEQLYGPPEPEPEPEPIGPEP